MQREKGASFERWVANLLKGIFPNARRGIGQSRAANEVPDVDGSPFWVECKAHRKVQIQAAFRQALEAAEGRRPVVVISKDDREAVLATMRLEDFLRLLAVAKSAPNLAEPPNNGTP